ncbi:hypothetical protein D9753_03745 [Streptomyces dangxiongensis]|uniref:Uncharacterized protein n=1 Tax=Streptomyces dangxiongensis TaxID=1442032 RepID=A0A3G2JBS3_9ACTN|nr:hypothetical protein D9753_03745 [Streptomyces dangxiongensis]
MRFQLWAGPGIFQTLMEAVIAEAAARGQADLDLVSPDSTVARAHHHAAAAGMRVDAELLEALEKAVAEEGASSKGHNAPVAEPDEQADAAREERRRLRRRREARLRAAELGRSLGGLSGKVHLSADRRCRPLSFVLTAGQSADSPRFTAVLERIRVPSPVDRPRTVLPPWPRTRRTPPDVSSWLLVTGLVVWAVAVGSLHVSALIVSGLSSVTAVLRCSSGRAGPAGGRSRGKDDPAAS